MKSKPESSSAHAPVAATPFKRKSRRTGPPASNAALPAQNRRVLAQHYRAKYGVK